MGITRQKSSLKFGTDPLRDPSEICPLYNLIYINIYTTLFIYIYIYSGVNPTPRSTPPSVPPPIQGGEAYNVRKMCARFPS